MLNLKFLPFHNNFQSREKIPSPMKKMFNLRIMQINLGADAILKIYFGVRYIHLSI